MRILWMSNAPFCPSGYGVVTEAVTPRIKALGHEVAIHAFYGLRGSGITWQEGIPIYAGSDTDDWGNHLVAGHYGHFQADLLITLVDTWVLDYRGKNLNWVAYAPVDHDPMPPAVEASLKRANASIAMSRFGEAQLKAAGLKPLYAPHGVNTKLFAPNDDWRQKVREVQGWQDKFVVGTVASNKAERKNFTCMVRAFADFHKRNPNSLFYMQTNPHDRFGIDLPSLCKAYGLGDVAIFPQEYQETIGFPTLKMSALYNSFDVFLLPSKGEGFGIPLIEAQSCGVPVITTDYTACTELCGSGWLIKDYEKEWTRQNSWQANANWREVSQHLESAHAKWRKDKMQPLRDKAREFALAYDWDTVVDTYWKPVLAQLEEGLKHTVQRETLNVEPVPFKELEEVPVGC